ncbi:unnamed protein product [Trichobilharzia szidati]|nr:unnamed protein product [Trichobilharzia szidati]
MRNGILPPITIAELSYLSIISYVHCSIISSNYTIHGSNKTTTTTTSHGNEHTSQHNSDIVVAKWEFADFEIHIAVMLFLLIMILIKMSYHRVPYISAYIPESFVLIVIGIIFGSVVRYGIEKGVTKKTVWKLTPSLFFTYLLPPIVLESAYSLYNRTFSEYLGVVLLFAVLGTIFNFLIIGFMMHILCQLGAFGQPQLDFDVKGFLLFSSLIVAVDPVAVLAIFQDIGVELGLYYIVFGESLLNDAVTVVLYDIMDAFTGKEYVSGKEIGIGIASFFTVSLGGLIIGVLFGIITCLITRIKSRLNAFTLLLLAYFSYIMADCVGWSGIISMIGCGLVQAAYAFHNLDRHSVTMVRNLTKVVSEMSESVIFLFLGIEVVSTKLVWHTGYILWALVWCLIARAVVVFLMTAVINRVAFSQTKISFTQQIVLIYGGLRGAVAFSLAILIIPSKLGPNGVYNRELIVTATLFIILFTVGFMGITMKPLVKLLKIRMEAKQKLSLFDSLNDGIFDETLAGIESLVGSKGRNLMRDFILRVDEKYLRRFLQREPDTYDQKMLKVYEKIALKLHYATMRPSKTETILKDIPETLKYRFLTSHVSTVSIPGLLSANCSMVNLPNANKLAIPNNLPKMSMEVTKATESPISGTTRRRSSTITTDTNLAPEVKQFLRYARRPSLAPKEKRQLDFDEAFLDVMKSRSRALKHHIQQPNLERIKLPVNGANNQAYMNEDEELVNKLKTLHEDEADEYAEKSVDSIDLGKMVKFDVGPTESIYLKTGIHNNDDGHDKEHDADEEDGNCHRL